MKKKQSASRKPKRRAQSRNHAKTPRLSASARQSAAKLPAAATAATAPKVAAAAPPAQSRGQDTFPIVGIGASAGGLEALEEFLRHVPLRCGMAFVVVQHLDPTHKGAVVELLSVFCQRADGSAPASRPNESV